MGVLFHDTLLNLSYKPSRKPPPILRISLETDPCVTFQLLGLQIYPPALGIPAKDVH